MSKASPLLNKTRRCDKLSRLDNRGASEHVAFLIASASEVPPVARHFSYFAAIYIKSMANRPICQRTCGAHLSVASFFKMVVPKKSDGIVLDES